MIVQRLVYFTEMLIVSHYRFMVSCTCNLVYIASDLPLLKFMCCSEWLFAPPVFIASSSFFYSFMPSYCSNVLRCERIAKLIVANYH